MTDYFMTMYISNRQMKNNMPHGAYFE